MARIPELPVSEDKEESLRESNFKVILFFRTDALINLATILALATKRGGG